MGALLEMILSPNFSLIELTLSEVAARNDIDMTVSDAVLANLKRLCLEILEPIRAKVGKPVLVTSGFRPIALNVLVGGSKNSDHVTGCAADIHVPSMALVDLAETVESLQMQIPLKQCIIEFGQWVHVSIQPLGEVPRREFLTATRQDGQTVYSLGLNA
jgi:hypothetical protein